MFIIRFIISIGILSFLIVNSKAQETMLIDVPRYDRSIGKDVEVLVDDNSMFTPENVILNSSFKHSTQSVINIGVTDATLWCKFKVKNISQDQCLLEISNMALDSIWVYEIKDANPIHLAQTGSYVAFDNLQLSANSYVFILNATKDVQKEFLLKIKHTRGTQFSIYLSTEKGFAERHHKYDFIQGIYFGLMLLMILYNLFVYFSVKDKSYLYYVAYGSSIMLLNASLTGYAFEYLWPSYPILNKYQDILGVVLCLSGILFTMNFLETKRHAPTMHKVLYGFMVIFIINFFITLSGQFMLGTHIVEITSLLLIICFFIIAFRMMRAGYSQAKFFLYAWSILLLGVVVFVLKDFNLVPYNVFTIHSLQIGSAIEAILLSFALADKINIYKNEKEIAQLNMVNSLRENEKLILEQNQLLESKVEARTLELNKSLYDLKKTQTQLIQSEKLASLGELTAGIAHEIQNPLNFVNNFSEVSIELANDLDKALIEVKSQCIATQLDTNNISDAQDLVKDLITNQEKINHHGKRADAIVKGMLQHSRTSTGQKESTDINALCDEYLRLSYHGLRTKDKTFNADYEFVADEKLSSINVIPQDMGRVLLNIINNAFYACVMKAKAIRDAGNEGSLTENHYKPKVTVTTRTKDDKVEISIHDNGSGIPHHIVDKIFQPFFTTKPTGQGTGLGLSLAYDIVKAHGGELSVETSEGKETTFKLLIPLS